MAQTFTVSMLNVTQTCAECDPELYCFCAECDPDVYCFCAACDPDVSVSLVCEQTLEAYEGLNFAREALTRLRRPTGKPTSPGLTCRDIKEHNPDYKSGEYDVEC